MFFFSFPSAKDSKLVSLGSSKNFGEAKVTKSRGQNKKNYSFFCRRRPNLLQIIKRLRSLPISYNIYVPLVQLTTSNMPRQINNMTMKKAILLTVALAFCGIVTVGAAGDEKNGHAVVTPKSLIHRAIPSPTRTIPRLP